MPKTSSNQSDKVNSNQVFESLMFKRITIILNAQNSEGENYEARGYLRGFSENWIIIQEIGDEPKEPEDLTLINCASIQGLRKSLKIER
jgi:hypothetical protein